MAVRLLLAGCGKMGGAMLAGWLEQGITPENVTVVEPNEDTAKALRAQYSIATTASPDNLDFNTKPNVIVFAVKPQIMDAVAPAYARFVGPDVVYLSIAAGKPIAYFENILGNNAAIVRAMPNTPAAVKRGITVNCANDHVSNEQISLCSDLLSSVGEVAWVDDEDQIDIVTALSGGGPAYVFLLAECLGEAGIRAGLPAELAKRLARVTVAGSGELLHRSVEDPAALRQNVTSPGGTTAEALQVLMADNGWQPLIDEAIAAATAKSRELAK
jgi:pyrroline-5-carboxylate reductase